jgi:pimeloyl-ACP methyl ester carboxylesterase
VEGEGEPVTVFAHGLTNNRNELAAFTPLLPGTKVRFDFRGHGRSSSPADPKAFRFEDFARDLDAVASAFGATVAVGTAWRGRSGIKCREPDGPTDGPAPPAGLDSRPAGPPPPLAEDLEGKTPEEALESVLNDPARVAEYVETPWRLELDRVTWQHDDPGGLSRAIHGVVEDWPIPDRELLRDVRIPTIIVTIEGDEIHPAELGRLFAELLPNAELIALQSQEELLRRIPRSWPRVRLHLGER